MSVSLQQLPTAWGIQIKDKEVTLLSKTLLREISKQIVCEKKDLPIINFSNGRKETFNR